MNNIIFATQKNEDKPCGVGLIGKLIGESLIKSKKYNFNILYTDAVEDLINKIEELNPISIIYNFHEGTTPWAKDNNIRNIYSNIKHIMLHHDVNQNFINNYSVENNYNFKYVISPDTTLVSSKNIFTVNRLMPNYYGKEYTENDIPVIGFHGFGGGHKGISKIANKVVEEFDEAIIRLHIPDSRYGANIQEAYRRVEEVKYITRHKSNIKIKSSHELLETKEIIDFLSQNTINCYFYDYMDGAGLASSTDYALAARRPIAVTKSHQLRNFIGINPSICIEDNSLRDIISFGIDPLKNLYKLYSEENVIKDYELTIKKILEE